MLKDMKQWCLSHSHESAEDNHLEIIREGISLGKTENKVNTTYKYTKLNEVELRRRPLFCNFPLPLFYFTCLCFK